MTPAGRPQQAVPTITPYTIDCPRAVSRYRWLRRAERLITVRSSGRPPWCELIHEAVEVPSSVAEDEQHEDPGDEIGRHGLGDRRSPGGIALRIEIVDERLHAIGDVALTRAVVPLFEPGGRLRRSLPELFERVAESETRPIVTPATTVTTASSTMITLSNRGRNRSTNLDQRVEQQGHDRAGDDPAEGGVGGGERVATGRPRRRRRQRRS